MVRVEIIDSLMKETVCSQKWNKVFHSYSFKWLHLVSIPVDVMQDTK
jgi:hypothetical protein